MKQLLGAIFMIFSLVLNGQSSIIKVEYLCNTNLVGAKKYDGLNTLYFNTYESIYIHNNYPTKTSIKRVDSKNYKSNVIATVRPDDEGLPIYRNIQTDTMIWKTDYGKGVPRIIEPIEKIDWKILNQHKKLDRFECTKAVGKFYGREYEVWFTPDIPVSFGPYKLGGLPGLILQAKSKDNDIKYELRSIETTTNDIEKIQPPQKGDLINMEEFKNRKINSLLRVEAKYENVTHNDPIQNSFIEKNKWRIFSEYKKNRYKENKKN